MKNKSGKIGLLVCDGIRETVRHIDGEYLDMYSRLLPSFEFEPYHLYKNEFPEDVGDHDIYLCSGSSFSVYDNIPWIHKLKSFVQEINKAQKRFVGLCFGHQMIAHALGGKVEKAASGWCVGVHDFKIQKRKSWMQPPKDELNLLMLCQDQVVELPPHAELLFTGKDCPVAMISIAEKIIGIQAHPEFSKKYNQTIIEMRKERIGYSKSNLAQESLNLPIDTSVVSQWISNFINGENK